MGDLAPVPLSGLAFYAFLGVALGLIAAGITRAVYAIEDAFDRLPIHWMWWPALGAVAVGVVGYFAPDTLGVGYYNITAILSDGLPVKIVVLSVPDEVPVVVDLAFQRDVGGNAGAAC